ncbi:putative transcription factor bZIP family [Helianthus annuus]|uniref:Putative basic-leucine zipper domain-containing protein n=1 Tax=Helianthus annuus TaxID=4232 RepID=A0A251UXL1_HELAN|nr:bZIP transcription factor 11 isoform X1 [Helianthus annuus]KAF5809238.1 putative transcription factor bZIP family [Helianthus annuus]KAJ0580268.1 putative transcription factor bZIP family [Helianthus annuus]KAJ0587745.1 putative transcription factor bZIP family [Helianthus annuus]KAJ0596214.1 putative transcription factor bZIP family [Helianthus annuus]KAJ0756869.1 putative transcription factor bZIP family [Helianthus annuus]
MASSCGNSSGSDGGRSRGTYSPPNDGLMDEKKRKRMESNRESARRSRLRKQKHATDLTAESNKIKNDNDQIRATINVTTQRFIEIEAENSVLRAQVSELSQRLESLNEILNSMKMNANCTTTQCMSGGTDGLFEFDLFENPWNMMGFNQQPIMASADNVFGY